MTPCALNMFLLMLGAALLGYLLSWLLNRLRTQRIEQDLSTQKTAYGKLKGDYDLYVNNSTTLQGKYNELESGYVQINTQLNDQHTRNTALETELANCRAALQTAQIKYSNDLNTLQVAKDGLQIQYDALMSGSHNRQDEIDLLHAQLRAASNAQNALQNRYNGLMASLYDTNNELNAAQSRLNLSGDEQNELQNRYDNLLANHYDSQNELNAAKSQITTSASSDLTTTDESHSALQNHYDALIADRYDYSNELNALQNRLDDTTDQNNALQSRYDALIANQYDSSSELNALQAQLQSKQTDLSTLQAQYDSLLAAQYYDQNELNSLKVQLSNCQEAQQKIAATADDLALQTLLLNLSPEDRAAAERIAQRKDRLNFERIGFAAYSERDDLTLLKGIGYVIAQKLHLLGIHTFRQIANFVPEDEESVNEAIEFFPGRIKRERWQAQAQDMLALQQSGIDLHSTSENDLTFARIRSKISGLSLSHLGTANRDQADDLKALRGIGEWIEQKLNLIGIYTYRQIANLTNEDSHAIAEAIELFPEQIEKEQWVAQAQTLLDDDAAKDA